MKNDAIGRQPADGVPSSFDVGGREILPQSDVNREGTKLSDELAKPSQSGSQKRGMA
jgi:hypothetical protein